MLRFQAALILLGSSADNYEVLLISIFELSVPSGTALL